MKVYIFKYGRVYDQLNAEQLKAAEKVHGPLLGIMDGAMTIRVDKDVLGRTLTPKRMKANEENIKKARERRKPKK